MELVLVARLEEWRACGELEQQAAHRPHTNMTKSINAALKGRATYSMAAVLAF